MKGLNTVFLFYVGLVLPPIIGIVEYGKYAQLFSLISVSTLIIVCGFPTLVMRVKNRLGDGILRNNKIRMGLYGIQAMLFTIITIFVVITLLDNKSHYYFFVFCFSIFATVVIRNEKSLAIADGSGLIGQMPELIVYPIIFSALIAFYGNELTSFIVAAEWRLLSLLCASTASIAIAVLFSNKKRTSSDSLLGAIKGADFLIVLLPVLGYQCYAESITIVLSYSHSYEMTANYDIAKRFGMLPILLIASFLTPSMRGVRMKYLQRTLKNSSEFLNLRRNSVVLVILASALSIFSAFLYQNIIMPDMQHIFEFTLIFCVSWTLICRSVVYLQAALVCLSPQTILRIYLSAFILSLSLALVLLVIKRPEFIPYTTAFFIIYASYVSKKKFNQTLI